MIPRYYISATLLEERGACEERLREFIDLFGDGEVPLTIETVRRAMREGLPMGWPAGELFMRTDFASELEKAALEARAGLYGAQARGDDREVLRLLRKTAKLWARYHKGER